MRTSEQCDRSDLSELVASAVARQRMANGPEPFIAGDERGGLFGSDGFNGVVDYAAVLPARLTAGLCISYPALMADIDLHFVVPSSRTSKGQA
jgi:hypothetical protein